VNSVYPNKKLDVSTFNMLDRAFHDMLTLQLMSDFKVNALIIIPYNATWLWHAPQVVCGIRWIRMQTAM